MFRIIVFFLLLFRRLCVRAQNELNMYFVKKGRKSYWNYSLKLLFSALLSLRPDVGKFRQGEMMVHKDSWKVITHYCTLCGIGPLWVRGTCVGAVPILHFQKVKIVQNHSIFLLLFRRPCVCTQNEPNMYFIKKENILLKLIFSALLPYRPDVGKFHQGEMMVHKDSFLQSYENLLRKKESRLTRISICIVWLFILCHAWKLIPTIYELLYSEVKT